LAVSIDRVGLKPPDNPNHPEYDHKGMIHWDTDMTKYPGIPFHVQGVLALTDTEPEMGGFQCIPETYQHLDEFLKTQSREKIESRNPDYTGYSITRPRLAAGDLLIWTSLLLHGNGHNTSNKPRLCQYISMNPAAQVSDETRRARIEAWRHNTPPPSRSFPGDPRRIEEQRTAPAQLTDLGRKVLGLDTWS
ncbi:MAG: phytanoyl-CoA dioxygenase family protein, partial [Chloroflexi bacterium]|nr:phytanoyl-CoA dioxygenase family protein [Chloroflexota bacterium]